MAKSYFVSYLMSAANSVNSRTYDTSTTKWLLQCIKLYCSFEAKPPSEKIWGITLYVTNISQSTPELRPCSMLNYTVRTPT